MTHRDPEHDPESHRSANENEPEPRRVDLRPGQGRFFEHEGQRSNEQIQEEICERLRTHPDVDARDIHVRVAEGMVTLTGSVESKHQRRVADLIAEDALGTERVKNELHVRHAFWENLTGTKAAERHVDRKPERDADG
jgi:hypothetical protein